MNELRIHRRHVSIVAAVLALTGCAVEEAPPSSPSTQVDVPPSAAPDGATGAGETDGQDTVSTKTEGEPEIVGFVTTTIQGGKFPTYLTASLPNIGHLFPKITVRNPSSSKRKVVLHASLDGYTKAIATLTLDLEAGETKAVWLDAALDYEALSKLASAVDSMFSLKLTTPDNTVLYAQTRAVTVLPKNTVYWKNVFNQSNDGKLERTAVVGSFTTPQDGGGAISRLLQEAAQRTSSKSLSGYQAIKSNTTAEQASAIVNEQADAIYTTLKARGLNYTDIANNFFDSAQTIRFPAESLRDKTANCIDGTVVFTSAFEALGMESAVVYVPGHAFVGVHLGPKGTSLHSDMIFIETTMLGSADYRPASLRARDEFKAAVAANNYFMVEVSGARSRGFLPFPL